MKFKRLVPFITASKYVKYNSDKRYQWPVHWTLCIIAERNFRRLGQIELYRHTVVLLCLTLLHLIDTVYFANWSSMVTCIDQVYQCHVSNSICSLPVSVSYFGNYNISNIFTNIIFIMVAYDPWYFMLLL